MTQKQKTDKQKFIKFLTVFNKLLCILVICSGISFVAGINDLSIKGFVLQELKSKVTELKNENKNIELTATELESYENIHRRAEDLKMVKVDKIDYVMVVNDVVAMK